MLVLVIAMNLLVTSLSIYGTAFIDMTPEGLYTLRPAMVDACYDVFYNEDGSLREPGIEITFCNDRDNLIKNAYTRVVYYMAIALSKKYKNCTVNTVNVNIDPMGVAQYKTSSLTKIEPTDVIISYGQRHRIVATESFWRIGDKKVYSFDGEHRLASILLSLTLVNRPAAYFVTDHAETYYDPSNTNHAGNAETYEFKALLEERGLEIKNISLSQVIEEAEKNGTRPELPEDCVLLIINDPKQDFRYDETRLDSFSYVSETELIDRFLAKNRGAIMVAKDYRIQLPVFEDFLKEWGIKFSNTLVKDEEQFLKTDAEDGTVLITDYNELVTSYGYEIYGNYVELSSAPKVIVGDTGHIECTFGDATGTGEAGTSNTSRVFDSFLYSSVDSADYGQNDSGEYLVRGEFGKKTVASVTGRKTMSSSTGDSTYSYVFCAASADFFSEAYLGNASYANYDVVSSLVHNIARLETHASSELGGLSMNASDENFLGKMLVEDVINDKDKDVKEWDDSISGYRVVKTYYGLTDAMKIVYSVIFAIIPLAIAIVGVVVCVRRKYK
jgi:hypothetical protein